MNSYDIFHLNSYQDRQRRVEPQNPFAGVSLRCVKQVAKEVIVYWWHQTGYILCPEED